MAKDKFKELGCEFKNEETCEEELDEEGEELNKAEREHFGEEEE